MIREIEELRAEFDPGAVGYLEFFEQREIDAVKTGTDHLTSRSAQGSEIALSIYGDNRRIRERCRIHPLIDIMLSTYRILSRNHQGNAAHAGGSGDVAGYGERYAILQSQNTVHSPAANDLVHHARRGRK